MVISNAGIPESKTSIKEAGYRLQVCQQAAAVATGIKSVFMAYCASVALVKQMIFLLVSCEQ